MICSLASKHFVGFSQSFYIPLDPQVLEIVIDDCTDCADALIYHSFITSLACERLALPRYMWRFFNKINIMTKCVMIWLHFHSKYHDKNAFEEAKLFKYIA